MRERIRGGNSVKQHGDDFQLLGDDFPPGKLGI